MARGIELGVPTEYGFELPRLRHALSRPYVPSGAGRLLDFGSGNGSNTVLFAPDATTVVGVEVEPARVDDAIAQARRLGVDNVTYVVYDGRRLPFPDASFDHAISYEVLEHTADDGAALDEVARVLSPGAMLTLTVPNKWYLMETHGMHLRPTWVPWNRVPLLSWLPTRLHERWAKARIYSRRRLLGLLAAHGFEVVEHRYLMPPLDRLANERARAVLRKLVQPLADTPLRVVGVAHFVAARNTRGT